MLTICVLSIHQPFSMVIQRSQTSPPRQLFKYNLTTNQKLATRLITTSPAIHITTASLCSPILPFKSLLNPVLLPTRLPPRQVAPTTTSHPFGVDAHSPCARLFFMIHRTSPFAQNAASVFMTHFFSGHSSPRDLRSRSQDTLRRTLVSMSLLEGVESVLRFGRGYEMRSEIWSTVGCRASFGTEVRTRNAGLCV